MSCEITDNDELVLTAENDNNLTLETSVADDVNVLTLNDFTVTEEDLFTGVIDTLTTQADDMFEATGLYVSNDEPDVEKDFVLAGSCPAN